MNLCYCCWLIGFCVVVLAQYASTWLKMLTSQSVDTVSGNYWLHYYYFYYMTISTEHLSFEIYVLWCFWSRRIKPSHESDHSYREIHFICNIIDVCLHNLHAPTEVTSLLRVIPLRSYTHDLWKLLWLDVCVDDSSC